MKDYVSSLGGRGALFALLLTASCTSYLPFSDRVADRYSLGQQDRALLQYFVSDEFCLRRDTTDENAHITAGGTVRYFRGRRIEELRVRRHTPGAAVFTADGGLGISFVPGDDRSAIPFVTDDDRGADDGRERDEDRSGRFAAPPAESRSVLVGGRYVLQGDATHPIPYDGKSWTVHYDRRPYLLIRSRDVEDKETRVKTLPGRKVGK